MNSKLRMLWAVLSVGLPFLLPPWFPHVGDPLYPDLQPLRPRALQFDTVTIDGEKHTVLRFTTIIWNQGEGPLEVQGKTDPFTEKTVVYQRLYDEEDHLVMERRVGEFVWHEGHDHFHFGDFAEYQLWTRSEYDQWLANGRPADEAEARGRKTTFCIRDNLQIEDIPGSPSSAVYGECTTDIQGISVGWGDRYKYNLPDQWVDVGDSILPDGEYVLRVIADPLDRLYESPEKSDAERESHQANEAVRFFRVADGAIEFMWD